MLATVWERFAAIFTQFVCEVREWSSLRLAFLLFAFLSLVACACARVWVRLCIYDCLVCSLPLSPPWPCRLSSPFLLPFFFWFLFFCFLLFFRFLLFFFASLVYVFLCCLPGSAVGFLCQSNQVNATGMMFNVDITCALKALAVPWIHCAQVFDQVGC